MSNINFENTQRAVNGLACTYAPMIDYNNSIQPGTEFQTWTTGPVPAGMSLAKDLNGNPIYDKFGRRILLDSAGKPIPITNPRQSCGSYTTFVGAYNS